MDSPSNNNELPKFERLCGENNISTLLKKGRFTRIGDFKLCYYQNPDAENSRIMVSVPKKLFKRAVKRNLLKRRIRESYRLQKDILNNTGFDLLFIYQSKDILNFEQIYKTIGSLLKSIEKGKK